jgi:N-glycosylase/DNA lyase
MTILTIRKPERFDLRRTLTGHGWSDLPPFRTDDRLSSLETVIPLSPTRQVHVRIGESAASLRIAVFNGALRADHDRRHIVRTVRSMLRMDESFDEFYALCRTEPHLRWVPRAKAGRLLRSPTVFEDVVKMMFTTNCSWALTRIMTHNLTRKLGNEIAEGVFSFPAPTVIASVSERWLRKEISCGYRAPYLLEVCRSIAKDGRDLESLRHADIPTEELYDILRTIKGIGHYAAGNLLKLMGRYDYLGIDSWIRRRYSEMHTKGRTVSDRAIERHYARYGRWRGLVCWMEATGD